MIRMLIGGIESEIAGFFRCSARLLAIRPSLNNYLATIIVINDRLGVNPRSVSAWKCRPRSRSEMGRAKVFAPWIKKSLVKFRWQQLRGRSTNLASFDRKFRQQELDSFELSRQESGGAQQEFYRGWYLASRGRSLSFKLLLHETAPNSCDAHWFGPIDKFTLTW
jgi:hypothetical protein